MVEGRQTSDFFCKEEELPGSGELVALEDGRSARAGHQTKVRLLYSKQAEY